MSLSTSNVGPQEKPIPEVNHTSSTDAVLETNEVRHYVAL